jgi:hypothetical protein
MTVIYYLLTFAAGFFFGVFATALVAFSGDKEKREYDKVKKDYDKFMKDYDVMKNINGRLLEEVNKKPLLLMPHDIVPKDVTMDEFCKWWKEEGYKYVEKRYEDNLR